MSHQSIFDHFPPPKFLDIPYVGISVSDTFIRAIQFIKKNGKLHLGKYAERPLPAGAVVSGSINNRDEVIHVLEGMKKEIGIEHAKVSLPEEKAYLFTTKIPIIASQDIRSAIEFKMEENVPVPTSELIFDYEIPDPNAHPDHMNVVVSSLPVSVVDVYTQTVYDSGILLLSLEIESQAMARALISPNNIGTTLIINWTKEKIGLYVAYRRVVHFTSTVSTGDMSDDIMTALSAEINKLFTYWHLLKENVGVDNKKISQIILCGENIPPEVVPYISAHNKTPTILGNVWTNAFDVHQNVPEISFADSLRYAPAIGLALPSDILI